MTQSTRQRLHDTVACKAVTPGVLWGDGFWPETRARWQSEGMPTDFCFGDEYRGGVTLGDLGVEIGFHPPYEQKVVADEGAYELIQDQYGIIKRIQKGRSGMPQFVQFPVSDRASWEKLKPRLDPANPNRYAPDWPQRAAAACQSDALVTLVSGHLSGFFSLLRELTGDRVYYLFFDAPDLARDILDFQVYRLTTYLREITRVARIDRLFIWEDMCYKRGPLVSPDLFRQFLLEPYRRTIAVARERGVEIIDVDSDGNINELIPLWLEADVNLLHPMEVAAGMDVVAVKRAYGSQVAMHGGVDKRALAQGREAIDREFARIRPAYELGGYIPHVDHSVPPDVSWDSYLYYLRKRAELLGWPPDRINGGG